MRLVDCSVRAPAYRGVAAIKARLAKLLEAEPRPDEKAAA